MQNHKVYEISEIKNFRELLNKTVNKYPDNIAYKFKKDPKDTKVNEIKYKDFKRNIEELSTALIDMGLENKKIALISENRYEWCTSYLSITTSNMVVVPLDKALPEKELESLIVRSEVEAVIFEEKYKEIFKKVKENKKSCLNYYICMDNGENDIIDYNELLERGKKLLENGDKRYENMRVDENKMSVILFTSGTTSQAKAVMLSQYNICENVRAIASHVKLYPTDILLSFLPLHHTFECTITFLYGLYFGVTVAFCDGLRYIAQNLKEYKITVFVAVPLVLENMYKKLQKGIEESGKKDLLDKIKKVSNILLKYKIDLRRVLFKSVLKQLDEHLRVVLYGAAPMDPKTIIGYNELGIALVQGYGLTETSPVISTETDKEKRPGSVGIPLYNIKIKIEKPNDEGIGEIVVKGPSVMLGYYKNEEETKKVLKDGWFYTGDYGYLDKDEFLYVTGRKKDIIVLQNGKNVYPQEVEFLINKIPYVKESIVYQRGQDQTDTMLCAKIVYDKELIEETLGKKSEEEYKEIIWKEIKEINKTIPGYKHVKNITITTKPLIKTTTQKVKRFEEVKQKGQ